MDPVSCLWLLQAGQWETGLASVGAPSIREELIPAGHRSDDHDLVAPCTAGIHSALACFLEN